MKNKVNLIGISDELCLQQYRQGVKLIRPDKFDKSTYTVKSVLELPFCVYFINQNSQHQKLNEHSAAACDFSSVKDGIGKSIAERLKLKSALRILNNDLDVMKSNRRKIVEEPISYKNEKSIEGIAVKIPWYNSDDKIIGIFGCSIVYGLHSNPDFIEQMLGLHRETNNKIRLLSNINGIYITRRERDILNHTLRGKSAKEVGHNLHISQKTVEFHLDNLKLKFRASSKSELIDNIISHLIDLS